MDDLPPAVYWILIALTLAIHLGLASGIAFQTSNLLNRLPPDRRRISPQLSWLLLIPVFNCIWIWVMLLQTSRSFEHGNFAEPSSMRWGIAVAASYSLLFFALDPNWAWVAALLLFIPYRKKLLLCEQQCQVSELGGSDHAAASKSVESSDASDG